MYHEECLSHISAYCYPARTESVNSFDPLMTANYSYIHLLCIFTLQANYVNMETSLFPHASLASHGHLHGLPTPYLLAAAAAQHHSLNTSPPPHLPPLPTPPSHHPPPPFSHYSNAASALTRLTSSEHISQSVSKSASVTAIAASLVSNAKYSIASLTSNAQLKCNDELQR